MANEVYITRLSTFLPNEPVQNEEMEDILGKINDKPSRSKSIILRQNKIKTRYYAIDKNGDLKYTNAEMTANAIKGLFDEDYTEDDMEVLSCGTSIADQILPSHASMVHGKLGNKPLEIIAPSGVCCAGMHAFKFSYLSVLSGNSDSAVSTGSELISTLLSADKFKPEALCMRKLEENPILGFEKDFLRWMLSDGAGAVLMQNKPNKDGISLKVDWVDTISYANELDACMYAGAEKKEDGDLKGWKEFTPEEWLEKSIFSVKQDVKLLGSEVVHPAVKRLKELLEKYNIDPTKELDYFLPHLSSMFFKDKLLAEMADQGVDIAEEKWYTNLTEVGNVGSASIYLILDSLFKSNKLEKGQKIILFVPESGRFSYAYAGLTVC